MYFIQEADNPQFLSVLFNNINLVGDKLILPIKNNEISSRKAEILAKKTNSILSKSNGNKIVVSNEIKKCEMYINYLYSYQYDIIDGKWLAEVLINKILDYIIEKKKLKKQETVINIVVNDLNQIVLENMKLIIKEYKRVNIVTNHIEKFKKIEQQVLEDEGIMITISNNKKNSLSKSKIILNIDFPTELINKYNINDTAIIVNLKGNVKINKKRFNGLNINDFEISFDDYDGFDYDKQNKYKSTEIYEAKIYKKAPYKNIIETIEKDKVKIKELKGVNRNNIIVYKFVEKNLKM